MPGAAEEVFQRLGFVVVGGEDHAGVALHAQAGQRQLGLVEDVLVAVRIRQRAQLAVQAVGPAVVRAGEAGGVALVLLAHGGATVPAAVLQHVDVVLLVAHHDHRTAADGGGLEVTGVAHFALVGDPHPGAVENLVQLDLEQRGVVVQRDIDAVALDQFVEAAGFGDQAHAVLLRPFSCWLVARRPALVPVVRRRHTHVRRRPCDRRSAGRSSARRIPVPPAPTAPGAR
ncbi:hypothetical protein D3C76_978650 [compost metagenome]